MSQSTDRTDPEGETALPEEPPNDNFSWTAEPEDPDAAGMPGEYVNETGESVPGVRRSTQPPPGGGEDFDQESNN